MAGSALGMLGLLVSLTTSRDMGPHLAVPETPPSTAAAEVAPDFAIATAYGWHSFRDVHDDTPVVLVFEPDDAVLTAIESELPTLQARGVEITAVTRDSDGTNWKRIERLGLRYALYSDPRGHLATLFGLGEPTPAWCVIDAQGRIVELRQGLGAQGLLTEIERALPEPESASGDEMK